MSIENKDGYLTRADFKTFINDMVAAGATSQGEGRIATLPSAAGGQPAAMLAVSATASPTQVTLTTSEQYIVCDATSGRVELTLPAASGNSGLQYTIRKTDTSTHNVFVCPAPSMGVADAALSTMTGGAGQGYYVDNVTGALPSTISSWTAADGVPIIFYNF